MSDLDILNELSELDVRDNGLKKAVVSIPEEIAELNEKLENTENRIEEINSEIEDIEKDLRKSERELEDLNIHLERYNQQIMEVKTNKEYHSIQTEIETAKKGINDTEEIIIELMDRMGYIETERGDIKREFDNERAPLLEKVARFRNELNDIEV
ncbi:MAG: hypothetical protein GY771_01965, partial [bacterium]|nr:hypothetical protein [bacterium]